MTMRISDNLAIAMVEAAKDMIDTGVITSYLRVYSGTKPTIVNEGITTQVLLLEYPLPEPSFAGTVMDGPRARALGEFIGDVAPGLANDTATWFRITGGTGAPAMDGDVTITGGGGDAELTTTAITIGMNVTVTAAQITHDI